MDKKTALTTLLENSFWVSDEAKKGILERIDTLTDGQIDQLGKFLAGEREVMLKNKDRIMENSSKLLDIIGEAVLEENTTKKAA